MAINPTGLPSQTSGGAHLASIAFLAAHALIALGLFIGTVDQHIMRTARNGHQRPARRASLYLRLHQTGRRKPPPRRSARPGAASRRGPVRPAQSGRKHEPLVL